MGCRRNIYFTDTTAEYVDSKSNMSEYIQRLIIKDMNDKSQYLEELEKLHQEKKQLQIQLTEVESKISIAKKEIERIDAMKNNRPVGYDDVVDLLLSSKLGVTKNDLVFHANGLGVEVGLLKMWLFDDGVYDKLLLK